MRRKDAEEEEEEEKEEEERRVDEEGGQSRRSAGRREVTEGREEAGRGQTDGREVQRTLPRPAYPHRACNCNCSSRESPRVKPGEIALDLVQHTRVRIHTKADKERRARKGSAWRGGNGLEQSRAERNLLARSGATKRKV